MKNLVISPTGNESLFRSWISDNPDFDLALLCYEDIKFDLSKYTPLNYRMQGEKWSMVKRFIIENIETILRYDNFWFPDDDILTDSQSINLLFDIHTKFGLDISQPSIKGPQSFQITKNNPDCVLRYTNFVEVMCPLMTKSALMKVFETFDYSKSGWGLDLIWQKVLNTENSAIIDEVIVEHTRGVGKNYKGRFKVKPSQELKNLMIKHDLTLNPKVIKSILKKNS